MQFRLLLWENEVIITSGGIRRQTDGHGHEGEYEAWDLMTFGRRVQAHSRVGTCPARVAGCCT